MALPSLLRPLAAAAIAALVPAGAPAQPQAAAADANAAVPAPRAGDVDSIDSILAALYGTISGGVGETRDWERFRSLFHPGARLIPTGTPKDADKARARVLTPEDYIRASGPLLERIGFRETEVARRVDRFGHVAQVFSTYEGHSAGGDVPATLRGINSIQLFHDGSRWWILNVLWMQESDAHPIPGPYLPPQR